MNFFVYFNKTINNYRKSWFKVL